MFTLIESRTVLGCTALLTKGSACPPNLNNFNVKCAEVSE